MEKLKMNANYLAALVCLVILVIAGSFFVYTTYFPPEDLHQNQTQNPGSECDPLVAVPRVPVPVDTSIPIRDPIPGIRYSLNESDSGKTIVLGKGDVFEINLRWIPSLALQWIIPVSGCGLEMVNDGTYSDGGDYWNNTGHYRARYRAISSGISVINGTFGGTPGGMAKGMPEFNLTVIVK